MDRRTAVRRPLTAAALVLAALAAGCWSDIKDESQNVTDSAAVPATPGAAGPGTEGGMGTSAQPNAGPLPTPVDTTGGPARAGSTGRDTTAASRPPQR